MKGRKRIAQAKQLRTQLDGVPSAEKLPPARVAYIPIDTALLGQILGFPEGLEMVGVQISEDGRQLGLIVEWERLPLIQYGSDIPRLIPHYSGAAHRTPCLLEWVSGEERLVWPSTPDQAVGEKEPLTSAGLFPIDGEEKPC